MQLRNLVVKNFRLLHDAGLILEKQTTVIVGRNNSGKTSLTEVMKRLLEDSNPSFRLEDFSFPRTRVSGAPFWLRHRAPRNRRCAKLCLPSRFN